MEDKYEIYIHPTMYTNKPILNDYAQINNEITQHKKEVTVLELLMALSFGQTVLPSIMNKNIRKQNNFSHTNFIFIDIDNKDTILTIDDLLDMEYVKDNCLMIYETLSSTHRLPKYRLVFLLSEPITNKYAFKKIYDSVLEYFPTADKSCNDCARLFLGGKSVVFKSLQNKLDINMSEYELEDFEEKEILAIDFENYITNLNTINWIKSNQFSELKEYYSNLSLQINTEVESKFEADKLLYSLDMFKLLGIPYKNLFNCIFSFDKRPSASIFQLETGEFIYKRFSSESDKGYVLNNVQLFSKLANKDVNECKAILYDIFNIKVNYGEDYRIQDNKIDEFILSLSDLTNFPKTKKVLNKHSHIIVGILELTKNYKFEYFNADGNLEVRYINHLGSKYMANAILGSNKMSQFNKLSKVCNLLVYLKILKKLSDEDIPKSLFEKLNQSRIKNNNKYRKNLFELNFEGLNLNSIELLCAELLDMGYTFNGFSQDFLTLNEDRNKSNEIYVQDKNKEISKKLSSFIGDLNSILDFDSEYVFEKDIKEQLLRKGYSKSYIIDNYSKVINLCLTNCNLMKVRLNKEQKDFYKITNLKYNERPNIFVKL